jgi:hypothetical protein
MNELDGFLFDGNAEIRAKLERGQSFGLNRQQYHSVVTCGLSAEKYASIQPAAIRRLADGEAGCVLTLWGKQLAYIVTFKPEIHFLSLAVQPIDSTEKETVVLSLSDDALAWSRVISAMITLEGVCAGLESCHL